jgi:hypothetical protein
MEFPCYADSQLELSLNSPDAGTVNPVRFALPPPYGERKLSDFSDTMPLSLACIFMAMKNRFSSGYSATGLCWSALERSSFGGTY